MMKCVICKKLALLDCRMCNQSCCQRHILLELHACPEMSKKIQQAKEHLQNKVGDAICNKKSLLYH